MTFQVIPLYFVSPVSRASAALLRRPSALRAPSRLSLRSSHPLTKPRAATGPGGERPTHGGKVKNK